MVERVVLIDEITSSKDYRLGLNDEIPKHSHYLCFSVSVKTNKFALKDTERYFPHQEQLFQTIKSPHESGLGYSKIAHHLNENGITTHNGKKWGGNSVYLVLKRHKGRKDSL